jgi:hypothetical protein
MLNFFSKITACMVIVLFTKFHFILDLWMFYKKEIAKLEKLKYMIYIINSRWQDKKAKILLNISNIRIERVCSTVQITKKVATDQTLSTFPDIVGQKKESVYDLSDF